MTAKPNQTAQAGERKPTRWLLEGMPGTRPGQKIGVLSPGWTLTQP